MAFDTGLFTQQPRVKQSGPTLGGGLSFAATAINNATTVDEADLTKSILDPINRRRRKNAHTEAVMQGAKPGSPEYFDYMQRKLTEFGDLEGAEIVMNKAQEFAKQGADIRNVESTIKARDAGVNLDFQKFDLDKYNTVSQLALAREELDNQIARTENDTERTRLEGIKVRIDDKLANSLIKQRGAETAFTQARTQTENEMRDFNIEESVANTNRLANEAARIAAQTTGLEAENAIVQTVGLDTAKAKLEGIRAEAEKAREQAASIRSETEREEYMKPFESAVKDAQAKAYLAGAQAELIKAQAYAGNQGGSDTKSRKITKADTDMVGREIDKFLDDDGLKGQKKEISTAVAYKLEALRVKMGDDMFQTMITTKNGRESMVRGAYESVTSGNVVDSWRIPVLDIGIGREFNPTASPNPTATTETPPASAPNSSGGFTSPSGIIFTPRPRDN